MSKLHYGTRVRSFREERGISREELARLVGTSTSTMDRIELTGHKPRADVLQALAANLGLTLDELLNVDAAASA